uniref:Endoplasmic reticulum-Golgi intermediate compartment protein n=1 Tax=Sphenodon punctatus TaxID=8508 RepID=A0A8D0HW06_SPHPU
MRRLNRKKTLNLMKELDAFPKVPESYVETTTSGGTVSLIAFTTMALLTIMEFMVYRDTWMKYEYEVDKDFTSLLCYISKRCYFLLIIQSRLQEEHSLQDVIFKSAFKSASTALPPREDNSLHPPDACRIHGHLYVNKVAGNFHITVGKAIPHPRGHAHLAALVSHESYNFSHRIDHLSFGELIPGIINPLDGTEKIATDRKFFFETPIQTKGLCTIQKSSGTNQGAPREVINHAAGSHGVSGIFMKYDISSLMVTVTEEHMPFWQFLVRLCGIIGGIFSTTGILHGIGRFVVEIICCRFRLGAYKSTPVSLHDSHINNHLPLTTDNSTR